MGSDGVPTYAFGVISNDDFIYVYPEELKKEKLLTNFLGAILVLADNIARGSRWIVFRVGGRIYAISRINTVYMFFSGPPELEDEKASNLLRAFQKFIQDNFASIDVISGEKDKIDKFVSDLVAREYEAIKIRRIHPAKIILHAPLARQLIESGEIKAVKIEKVCRKMLENISPKVFLGEVLERLKIGEEEASKCLEKLYGLGYVIEAPDRYVNAISILKMLNIVAYKTMALIGKSTTRSTILEIIGMLPEKLREQIIFDEKKMEIDWKKADELIKNPILIMSIGEHEYASFVLALKKIINELFKKFGEILGKELQERLNKIIVRELEEKLRIYIT